MRHIPARLRLAQQPLTPDLIHAEMSRLFPAKNDFGDASFDELVPELATFGINTLARFRSLMKKHRRNLMADNCVQLTPEAFRFYAEWIGEEQVKDKMRRQYWFAYPAMVRSAAEMEFGEAASVRDEEQDDE